MSAHSLVVAPASGMVQYLDPVFHRLIHPIRALSYSRHLTGASIFYGHISFLVYIYSPSAFSRRAVVSYWRKYVHEVLVNRLGGLSLPRKSVVRLTDRPDMTIDVYRGRKTTMQCNAIVYICSSVAYSVTLHLIHLTEEVRAPDKKR